jgi:predicted nucleic-acid-binding Zn-ribbon protein
MNLKSNCPECGANEFVTEPNQYDILVLTKKGFEVQSTEQIDGCKVFCRKCSSEINLLKSVKGVVLKK